MPNEEPRVGNRRTPLLPPARSPSLPAPIMRSARRRPQPPDRPVVFSERVRASLIAAPPFTVTGRPVREVDQERAERGRGGPYCDYQPVSAPVFGHTLGGRGGGSGRWSGYRGRYLPSFLHGAPRSTDRRLIHTPKPTSSLLLSPSALPPSPALRWVKGMTPAQSPYLRWAARSLSHSPCRFPAVAPASIRAFGHSQQCPATKGGAKAKTGWRIVD